MIRDESILKTKISVQEFKINELTQQSEANEVILKEKENELLRITAANNRLQNKLDMWKDCCDNAYKEKQRSEEDLN